MTSVTSNDPAELLKSVKQTQKQAREFLYPGTLELFALYAAQSAGRVIGRDPSRAGWQVALSIAFVVFFGHEIWVRTRRRHNLGGRVSPLTWFTAGTVLLASVVASIALDGPALSATLSGIFAAGALSLGAAYRHALLIALGGIWALGVFGDHISATLTIALLVPYLAVVAWFGRKQLFNR